MTNHVHNEVHSMNRFAVKDFDPIYFHFSLTVEATIES